MCDMYSSVVCKRLFIYIGEDLVVLCGLASEKQEGEEECYGDDGDDDENDDERLPSSIESVERVGR